jgi:hypothetical protein
MRLVYLLAALLIVSLSALLFERFDVNAVRKPASRLPRFSPGDWVKPRLPRPVPVRVSPDLSAGRLSPVSLSPNSLASFANLVRLELKLLLNGRSWAWYVVAGGFILSGFFLSPQAARSVLPFAWLWLLVIWSEMGVRDRRDGVEPLLASAPAHLWRQTLAGWFSGVLLAVLLGSGALLRFLSEPALLLGFFAGALFLPALALFLGTATGNERPFQIILLVCWYLGALNGVPFFDITAAHDASLLLGIPWFYLTASFALPGLAMLTRRLAVNA